VSDPVKAPAHYTKGVIEVKCFIVDQGLPWTIGNAIKYLCRYRWKGEAIQDLEKAKEYIDMQIQLEREAQRGHRETLPH